MCKKVEVDKPMSQNKDKRYISHDHPKFGMAKFSNPKFQRLFQATQKRTTAESGKLSSKHKKSTERKLSKLEKMFRKVHNLNKNAVVGITQRDVNKDSRKLEFNYPPIAASVCRDGRFIQSKQIWVQGIPMDIAQINGLIEVLREDYELPISEKSKEELCSLVAASLIVPAWVKGSKPLEIIGSTISVGAFVFDLDEISIFTAVPNQKTNQTVLEFVTQATVVVRVANNKGNKKESSASESKEMNLTIVATPWTIEATKESEVRLVLRFHSFGMDAKSEMVHCVLQEIAIAMIDDVSIREIQIIPTIIFADSMPINVLDVVVLNNTDIDIVRLFVHFTGNASGGVQQVSFGGVGAVVMAGANVTEMNFTKMPTNIVHWATLYGSELGETHYITQLLIAGGCRCEDIASVLFAKPEQKLKKISSITVERKVSTRRALMEDRATIIFNTAQALHQFVAYFKHTEVWQEYPKIQVGFNEIPYTGSIAAMAEQHAYMGLEEFQSENPIEYVDSNMCNHVQRNLVIARAAPEKVMRMTQEVKCQGAIAVLKSAKRSMKHQDFQKVVDKLLIELAIPMKRKRETQDNQAEEHEIGYFNMGSAEVQTYLNTNSGKKEVEDMELDENSKSK